VTFNRRHFEAASATSVTPSAKPSLSESPFRLANGSASLRRDVYRLLERLTIRDTAMLVALGSPWSPGNLSAPEPSKACGPMKTPDPSQPNRTRTAAIGCLASVVILVAAAALVFVFTGLEYRRGFLLERGVDV
jgi:hypothetical protein